MKIYLDQKEILSINETHSKILCHDIPSEILAEDIERRLQWIIKHKCDHVMKRLKAEWIPKLKKAGITSIPLDDEAFAELVFSQPDYKDMSARSKSDV